MLYRFDNLELDLDAFELRRDGEVIPIRKKTFDVLRYLIEHRDRVVSKRELLERIWSGEHVNEGTVPWYISNLRKKLGQGRAERCPVETVHGRGYRFKSEIEIGEGDRRQSPLYSLVPPAPPTDADPFVGRERTMTQLTDAVQSARAGRGKILLLRGEAGIGKTRCAAELSSQLRAMGGSVWMGRCPETSGQPAFWPWIQILRNAAEARADRSPVKTESTRLLSLLVPHGEPTPTQVLGDPAQSTADRFWLYDRLHDFLRVSSAAEARVIVIDDVQRADQASLEFLSFIAPEVEALKLLFVITLRDHEGADGLPPHLQGLLRYADQIRLSGLDRESIERFLAGAGRFENNLELSRALYAKTGGNPLFIRETFRWLSSAFSDSKKELTAADLQKLGVPDVIKKLLQERLDTLGRDTRAVLDMASVAGRNIDLGLLSRALQCPARKLVAALDQARDAGLVTGQSATRFRFNHDLMREVAYEIIPVNTRGDYHKRIAEALLDREDRDDFMGEAAFHLHMALPISDVNSSIACAKRAAVLSASVHAHGDAATYYRWALDAVAAGAAADPRVEAELLLWLSQQERLSGDVERSLSTSERALRAARAHAYLDLVADIALLRRQTFLAAHLPDLTVLEALQEAVERVPEPDRALRARLLSQLALIHPYSADMSRCNAICQQALELAEGLGDRQSLRVALGATLYAYSGPDDTNRLLKSVDRILSLEKAGESTPSRRDALLARIMTFIHRGDMAQAEGEIEAYGALMKRLQMTEGIWLYQRLTAQNALLQGRFEEAAGLFAELARQGERIGIYYAGLFHRIHLGYLVRARQGMEEVLRATGDSILETYRSDPSAMAVVVARFAEAGLVQEARDDYRKLAARDFEDIPRNFIWLHTLAHHAISALALDDQPRIRLLYELLKPYAAFNTTDAMFLSEGSVAHFLAMLAVRLKKERDAFRHFERALEANSAMKMAPYLARTRVTFAEWLAVGGDRKHRARLRELAGEALSAAREMGMAPLVKRAEALLEHRTG